MEGPVAPDHRLRQQSLERFNANMKRVWDLLSVEVGDRFSPAQGPGLAIGSADLKRSATVLLHATIEDALRALQGRRGKGWSLGGLTDLRRACASISVSFEVIEDVAPLIVELAQRRQQIVHYADLDATGKVRPWLIADTWFCQVWLMAAHLIYFRLFAAMGPVTDRVPRIIASYEFAIDRLMEMGEKLKQSIKEKSDGDWLPDFLETMATQMEVIREGK